ncbi:unnamed protein product [Paramecium sonneborni]|uniref:Uncharacterized protein n=1 Tax=Paramecium sonneborni TaxID=65129 RepID=A0A8S1RE69_9CILI|nr:unnamed protein product [Paramecium sonneborni]
MFQDIQITVLYSIKTNNEQDFSQDQVNFLKKQIQQLLNCFPQVQVKGLYGCQRIIEIQIQQDFNQDIRLSKYLKESEKGNLVAIKFNNIILFCLILPESFFRIKPVSEESIENVLFRILNDLTDNIKFCLDEQTNNYNYFDGLSP